MTHSRDPRGEPSEHDFVDDEALRDHLVHDHARLPHELAGLPLASVHELEHFDETMGLLRLRHRHTG